MASIKIGILKRIFPSAAKASGQPPCYPRKLTKNPCSWNNRQSVVRRRRSRNGKPTLPSDAQRPRPSNAPSHARKTDWKRNRIGNACRKTALLRALSQRSKFTETSCRGDWRREGDSNPRNACALNGFRDRPVQPLRHLSTGIVAMSPAICCPAPARAEHSDCTLPRQVAFLTSFAPGSSRSAPRQQTATQP